MRCGLHVHLLQRGKCVIEVDMNYIVLVEIYCKKLSSVNRTSFGKPKYILKDLSNS